MSSVVTTTEVLTGMAEHLASVGMAKYDTAGGYLNDPTQPCVLLGDSDVPDTCVLLTVVGANPGLGDTDVAFGFRATGITPLAVESLADAVFDHFDSVMGVHNATFEFGSAVVLPELDWDGITVTNVERIDRGTAELTSPAKHKGSRFARTDTYRVTAYRE
jgi:hypothetical protein